MHFNAVDNGMAQRSGQVDHLNVNMDASIAAVYESNNSGIKNALQAKSRSDVRTKASVHIDVVQVVAIDDA